MKNSLKSDELTLRELIKEISSKGKEYLSIEVLFNLLFKITTEYIDYYESDLGEYLNNKLSKKYYLYVSLRIIVILGYLTTLSLFAFLETSFLSTICGVIAFFLLFFFIYIDKIMNKKYKYTTSFFQKTEKKLTLFKNKLNLILNNSYISEKFTTTDFEMINNNSNKLKIRFDNKNYVIQTYSYYLKKFALPSILFAPIITFFINLIYNLIQNPILINFDVMINFILGLCIFFLILSQNLNWIIKIKKSRKVKETPIYEFYEFVIIMILETLRLKLRMIQFPKEEKFKKGLLIAMKNIVESLNNSYIQK